MRRRIRADGDEEKNQRRWRWGEKPERDADSTQSSVRITQSCLDVMPVLSVKWGPHRCCWRCECHHCCRPTAPPASCLGHQSLQADGCWPGLPLCQCWFLLSLRPEPGSGSLLTTDRRNKHLHQNFVQMKSEGTHQAEPVGPWRWGRASWWAAHVAAGCCWPGNGRSGFFVWRERGGNSGRHCRC